MPPRKGPWHNVRADRRYRRITLLLPHRAVPRKDPAQPADPPLREVPVDLTHVRQVRSS